MVAGRSLPLGVVARRHTDGHGNSNRPNDGQATGVAFAGINLNSTDNIAGGATILTDHPDFFGQVILAGLHQANSDMIVGYDLGAVADFEVRWLSERPAEGTVAVGATQEIAVTFDATTPAIDQPGEYDARLLLTNDTVYGQLSIPVQMTVLVPPNWGKFQGVVTSGSG